MNGFKLFKSPDPDGVYPALLQPLKMEHIVTLREMFSPSIQLNHIPPELCKVGVVFISQGETLTPHLRILDQWYHAEDHGESHWYWTTLDQRRNLLSRQQHAYYLRCSIEEPLARKEYTLAAFLYVEGAFNNVELGATSGALNIQDTLVNWISWLLCETTIYPTLGWSLTREVGRGTLQGGVLSPPYGTLWWMRC